MSDFKSDTRRTAVRSPVVSERDTSWGIEPVPERLRVLGGLDLGLLWGNLGVSLLVIVAGAILVPALSLPAALAAILVGCLIGNLMLAVAGAIGAQARVPAMVLMRAPLGERGSYLPTTVNVVQCLGWTVFELLVIATAAAALSDELLGFEARWPWTLVFGAATIFTKSACGPGAPCTGTCVATSSLSRWMVRLSAVMAGVTAGAGCPGAAGEYRSALIRIFSVGK